MISQRLVEDMKTAMRAKDRVRLRTIRSLRAAITQKEISERHGGEATLSETDVMAVLQKQAKQRRDAIEQFRQANRDDLVQQEQEELDIINEYLPQPFTEAELEDIVSGVITETGASSMKDMGQVMGRIMPQVKGRADGRQVQQMVRSLLNR